MYVFGYFALLVLFLLFFGLSFCFGIREWLWPQDAEPLPVDVEYVRTENYFGLSFRRKIEEWMTTARPLLIGSTQDTSIKAVLEKSNGETILVLEPGTCASCGEHEQIVYCEGGLSLPQNSVFHREIYARGEVRSGPRVQLQAVAADGAIVLGFDNQVYRWVDARANVVLRRGTIVHSRVSSMQTIELEEKVSAQSLYAPRIVTAGYRRHSSATSSNHEPPALVTGRPGGAVALAEAHPATSVDQSPAYLQPSVRSRMALDTWLVQGDLELGSGTLVGSNLVVQGTLRSGPDCCFSASVKACRVELGPRNSVSGTVISGDTLELGESTIVGQNVVAERDILLRAGVRIGGNGRQAVVSAGRDVKLENNVSVCGKIAAGRAVVTI